MQSFSTQEKISRLISKIKIDWDRAAGGNQGVSRIDKDILTDDIKKLYELVYELGTSVTKHNKPYVESSPTKVVVVDIPDAPQTDIQLEPETEVAAKEDVMPEEQQQEEEPFSQPPLELEITSIETEETEVAPVKNEVEMPANQPNKVEEPEPDTKATLDLFSAAKTLADIYQNDNDNSLAAKIQNNKILDIKTAIGINDKFLFINEIFKGEMSAYNQAIEKLNQTADFSDAIHVIEELKSNYGNEENKTSFVKLFEIAKRRFH